MLPKIDFKMSDSDDEMPPPLEDMTEKVEKISQRKQKYLDGLKEIEEKNSAPFQSSSLPKWETSISASEDLKSAPAKTASAEEKKKKNKGGFCGFSAGFLSKPPPKKKKSEKKEEVEDLTHIKAKKTDTKENLKIKEVQEVFKDKKEEWWTTDLLAKIANNETLIKAFTSPDYRQWIELLQKDPKEAVKRYGTNPEFVQIMTEFSKIMGTHLEEVAQKHEEKDPIMDIINNDSEVKEIFQDPRVQAFIQQLQSAGGADLHYVMQNDPYLAEKLKILIHKKVLNVSSTM